MISVLKTLGKLGEDKATDYLKQKGYSILHKNYSTKFGEIDIIAKKNNCLYFVEVKTRTNTNYGLPHDAVNFIKIKHMKKTANYFLLKNQYKNFKLKLSVISILLNEKDVVKLDFFESIT